MIYNVKTISYLDSLQVRIYEKPVQTKKKDISFIKMSKKEIQSRGYVNNPNHERTDKQIKHSLESSVNRSINQIYSLARSNKWEYFVTLTINPNLLDSTDYILIVDKLSIWVNNLKKRYAKDLQYIVVPELHKDKEKWHFHALFSNVGNIPFTFSGKVCVGKYVYDYVKKPYATKIYNLPLWKYGYSTATEIRDSAKAGSYITKYITKDMVNILKNQHRFVASQNLNHAKERVYFLDYEKILEIMQKNLCHVDYVKNVKLPDAGQQITYAEFNKGDFHG